jgi:hypothetical protein
MPRVKDGNNNPSHFMSMVIRIEPALKPYIPIIGVGFTFLLDTWEFPHVTKDCAKQTRVALSESDREAMKYLMKHSGKSAELVVAAALIRARNSKVRPIKAADVRQLVAAAQADGRAEKL